MLKILFYFKYFFSYLTALFKNIKTFSFGSILLKLFYYLIKFQTVFKYFYYIFFIVFISKNFIAFYYKLPNKSSNNLFLEFSIIFYFLILVINLLYYSINYIYYLDSNNLSNLFSYYHVFVSGAQWQWTYSVRFDLSLNSFILNLDFITKSLNTLFEYIFFINESDR